MKKLTPIQEVINELVEAIKHKDEQLKKVDEIINKMARYIIEVKGNMQLLADEHPRLRLKVMDNEKD